MNKSQALTLTLLAGLAGSAQAEISGSGHQIQGCTGVIRSLVWHDTNRNGIQDAGERPLADVELQLERAGDPQLGADTLRTDSSGHVRFYNLCLQDHLLRVVPATVPASMMPTAINVGTARDVFDSDGSDTFEAVRIALDDDHSVEETVDFGFATAECSGAIGDRVWLDEDGNGLQDEFERGLAGIELRLEDQTGDVLGRAATDRQGGYRFAGLCPGTYTIALENVPAGFDMTPAQQGDDEALDGQHANHTLQIDGRVDSVDFGLSRTGCSGVIAGELFDDADFNAAPDIGEDGLTGVALFLDTADGYRQYALSDGSGRFELRGLCTGSYTVAVDVATLPADALPTTSPGLPKAVALTANDAVVELGASGYSTQCGGRIGDRVWLDLDGDGRQDADEAGLPGVRLLLRDGMGNAVGERTTDSNGRYAFAALCSGDYALQVDATSLPADFPPAPVRVGDAASDSDGEAPVWITLDGQLATNLTLDFGYLPPPSPVLRLDTECHPLSPESAEFDCDKPVSSLSMIWRGRQTVRVVAYLGDDEDDILTEVRNVVPGQRVEIDGYDDAPNDVMWRVFDEATGALVGDSWFHLSCSDKDMDGPEDCGKPQGDGKDGDECDGDCLTAWSLDGIVDKIQRLRCTGDVEVPSQHCDAQQNTLIYLQHELQNLGGSVAADIALTADYPTTLEDDFALALESGERVAFGGLANVPASTQYTVSASCQGGDAACAASRSTSVSATPVPDCSVYGRSRLKKDDDKIKWRLVNAGRRKATISRVDVSWPDAHGELKEIKRGGDKIMDHETPARSASFDTPMLHQDRSKRSIKRNDSEDIEFKFKEKSKDRRDDDYAITVYFEEGCSVTLTP